MDAQRVLRCAAGPRVVAEVLGVAVVVVVVVVVVEPNFGKLFSHDVSSAGTIFFLFRGLLLALFDFCCAGASSSAQTPFKDTLAASKAIWTSDSSKVRPPSSLKTEFGGETFVVFLLVVFFSATFRSVSKHTVPLGPHEGCIGTDLHRAGE